MEIRYYGDKISERIAKTPEGFLICQDVPISRTGFQKYLASELYDGPLHHDRIVPVYRPAKEVFDPRSLASFEGKPVTNEHPEEDVTPDNYARYACGHVQNVHIGEGEDAGKVLADLYITDPALIQLIKTGKREVSCGYYAEEKKDGDGRICQTKIRGNHVAVVDNGRAGNKVCIRDSNPFFGRRKKMRSRFRNYADALRYIDADDIMDEDVLLDEDIVEDDDYLTDEDALYDEDFEDDDYLTDEDFEDDDVIEDDDYLTDEDFEDEDFEDDDYLADEDFEDDDILEDDDYISDEDFEDDDVIEDDDYLTDEDFEDDDPLCDEDVIEDDDYLTDEDFEDDDVIEDDDYVTDEDDLTLRADALLQDAKKTLKKAQRKLKKAKRDMMYRKLRRRKRDAMILNDEDFDDEDFEDEDYLVDEDYEDEDFEDDDILEDDDALCDEDVIEDDDYLEDDDVVEDDDYLEDEDFEDDDVIEDEDALYDEDVIEDEDTLCDEDFEDEDALCDENFVEDEDYVEDACLQDDESDTISIDKTKALRELSEASREISDPNERKQVQDTIYKTLCKKNQMTDVMNITKRNRAARLDSVNGGNRKFVSFEQQQSIYDSFNPHKNKNI